MKLMKRSTKLASLLLAWFSFAILISVVSPIANPKIGQVVCSSMGQMKVVDQNGEGDTANLNLDCPACLGPLFLSQSFDSLQTQPYPVDLALETTALAVPIVSITAPPLPSRGPPQAST